MQNDSALYVRMEINQTTMTFMEQLLSHYTLNDYIAVISHFVNFFKQQQSSFISSTMVIGWWPG